MFPPPPTTPFRNSPSIDALSSRMTNSSSNHSQNHGSSGGVDGDNRRRSELSPFPGLSELARSIEMVGDPSVGTDVPLELLRSVMMPSSPLKNSDGPSDWQQSSSSSAIPNGLSESALIKTTGSGDSSSGRNGTKIGVSAVGNQIPSSLDFQLFIANSWAKTVAYSPSLTFAPVKHLAAHERKRILVTGGAGFVGSHLVDRLMFMGHDVTVLDNFFSGSKTAVAHWIGHPNFELVRHDVVDPFMIECDQIYHLACPASPVAYQYNSIKTMKTNFLGTMNMLGLAKRTKARFLLSSTSEIYGSPEQHPQRETYWGNVNPIGPRACYDEGKRVAEALTYGYARENGVEVRVARIFNTYGPRMSPSDGRLVSNFIMRAIKEEPIEVYGDGRQTRSLMYVFDLIDGLIGLMNSDHQTVVEGPVNLGSSNEKTVKDWAELIIRIVKETKRSSRLIKQNIDEDLRRDSSEDEDRGRIVYKEALVDDPPRRRPDNGRAKECLDWSPKWSAEDGIRDTVKFFMNLLDSGYYVS